MQYLVAFCSRREAAGDVIYSRFVELAAPSLDECGKFGDPRLNRSSEIQPKAVECGIFGSINIDRKQLATSFLELLWGRLSPISTLNFVMLA